MYYPDDRGFSWHAKNGEKRITSEEIGSKSCWACAISRPAGVWNRHTAPHVILEHELCAYLLAKTVPALSIWLSGSDFVFFWWKRHSTVAQSGIDHLIASLIVLCRYNSVFWSFKFIIILLFCRSGLRLSNKLYWCFRLVNNSYF